MINNIIDDHTIDSLPINRQFAAGLVITREGRLLLQQRGKDWDRFAGVIALFGGEIDVGETHNEGFIREINEELGGVVDSPIYIGRFAKPSSDGYDLIYAYLWYDQYDTITGCYEGEPLYFDDLNTVLNHDNVLPGIKWAISKAENHLKEFFA